MRKPKFNHRVHKDPLLVDTLSLLKQSTLFQPTASGFCFNLALIIQAWLLLEVFPSSKVCEVRNLRRALERVTLTRVPIQSREQQFLGLAIWRYAINFRKVGFYSPFLFSFFLFVASDKYNANVLDKYFVLMCQENLFIFCLFIYLHIYTFQIVFSGIM